MGQRRRYRRQQERLRAQTAGMVSEPASTSDVGATAPGPEAGEVEDWTSGPPAPSPSLLSRTKFTALGLATGAAFGGPVGMLVVGGVGAAIDWVRR